ncbi:hypothetical protein DL98DRAFT_632982, partial [Cadophora sp. DSE1049]
LSVVAGLKPCGGSKSISEGLSGFLSKKNANKNAKYAFKKWANLTVLINIVPLVDHPHISIHTQFPDKAVLNLNHRKIESKKRSKKHTTAGIRWWSPTQLLICRSEACVWQSGRDAQFSSVCGRM